MPQIPEDEGRNDLGERLQEARLRHGLDPSQAKAQPDGSIGIAARSGIEFVAAILVAVGIGVLLNRWLHSPIPLLAMLVLGFAAGLLNVYRAVKNMPYGATYGRREAAGDDEDES